MRKFVTKRLPQSTFEFPLAEIRRGYRSAVYFNRTKRILEEENLEERNGVMQVFQKNPAILCGMDEVIALLKQCVGHWSNQAEAEKHFDWYMNAKIEARKRPLDKEAALSVMDLEIALEELWVNTFDDLDVRALYDGDWISPWEPVLKIEGPYASFAHLESVYLGILARGTKVATNVNRVVQAARGKPVLFFADRFDRWTNQGADGYAAFIGGAQGVASDAMADWWGSLALGTMPHALIAMYMGDTASAAVAFNKHYPDVHCIALVDFNNDCVSDAIKCAQALKGKLWGVRLDTSENMVDPSVYNSVNLGSMKPTGVNPMLVEQVRRALDSRGYRDVKIIVSGGFDEAKINQFEDMGVATDSYAIGSSLLQGGNDFTADLVFPKSKQGRKEGPSDRLAKVT